MSNPINPASALGFLVSFLQTRVEPRRDERGASTVEWVVIAAIVVAVVIAVGVTLRGALEGQASNISNQINNPN